ncbi:MAG TPA: hypothetical protein PKC19_09670 [Roseiflexaceae bacterium]|nr:hypothetical protein [Roseiflexaceae bacterium]
MVQREHEQTELIAETIRRLPELVVYVFDQTRSAHRLQPEVRRIAWHAALATAAATTQGNGMRQARDLLLDTSIDGLAPREQALAAGAALAQRGKQRMRRDPASLRLSRRERGLVRRLAAILRLSSDLSAGGHCAVHPQYRQRPLRSGKRQSARCSLRCSTAIPCHWRLAICR